jgi:putative ABC transport system ATP-binding protein
VTEAVIELKRRVVDAWRRVHRRVRCPQGHLDLDIAARVRRPALSGRRALANRRCLMVLAGLERVDAGTVIDCRRTAEYGKSEDQHRRLSRPNHVGIVFQSFHLIPNMTALENVAVPLELAGRSDAFADCRAQELAARSDCRNASTHYPGATCRAANSSAWRLRVRLRPDPQHSDRRRADRQSRPGNRPSDRRSSVREGAASAA